MTDNDMTATQAARMYEALERKYNRTGNATAAAEMRKRRAAALAETGGSSPPGSDSSISADDPLIQAALRAPASPSEGEAVATGWAIPGAKAAKDGGDGLGFAVSDSKPAPGPDGLGWNLASPWTPSAEEAAK